MYTHYASFDIFRYLLQHPEYLDTRVNMSQFSFVTLKPLVENYVRKHPENYSKKRPAYLTDSADTPRLLAPGDEVNPVAWAGQANGPDL
ncbi:hypothetical protein DVH24_002041 [Malus domestica]|uniref:Uncharacterized protein n=1 Tax=Malus domestica TaxID=3750 RepID=A0A498IBN6_MALDO|nr:hypothetical protein DVH24_002041 [Malus domestica]